ncbi:MAG: hypothetical protein HYU99_06760 [Deltaproteobacteria bacterium]|nr:hypothetical protein [Deltaproteobacteria bacterium]
MSLKFFFNRKGTVITSLTTLGWLLTLWNLSRLFQETGRGILIPFTFLTFVILCLFITTTRFIPWYPGKFRGFGIEEHFEKTLVPASYIMVVTGIIYPLWRNCWPFLFFVDLLLIVIISVNFILLYFHFRDQDPLPPSYFAQNLHKNIK